MFVFQKFYPKRFLGHICADVFFDGNESSFHLLKKLTKGEWHGLVVSTEACHSKGRGFHIPVLPSFFAVVTATMLRWHPKRFKYGSWTPQSKMCGAWTKAGAAKTRWIDQQAKVEWNRRKTIIRFASKTIKWLTPNMEQRGEKVITCYCHLNCHKNTLYERNKAHLKEIT